MGGLTPSSGSHSRGSRISKKDPSSPLRNTVNQRGLGRSLWKAVFFCFEISGRLRVSSASSQVVALHFPVCTIPALSQPEKFYICVRTVGPTSHCCFKTDSHYLALANLEFIT